MALEQDQRISEVIKREQSRLRNFIRRRVPDPRDAEDILQDVFYELVEANRLLMPIEHVTGWLFRVARNRITDLFRKKEPENFSDTAVADFERRVIIERLEQCSWSQTEAAADLNVPLSTLNQKIKRLNIEVKRRRAGEGAEQG
ncbi:MAG: sigma-70 family RNA polymerase sigma factor [Bryobacteraceae bacterium]